MGNKRINNQRDLFEKVLPALKARVSELKRSGIRFVTEKDIWNYNKENKWMKVSGLTLAQLVDDIMNTDGKIYEEYTINKIKKERDE